MRRLPATGKPVAGIRHLLGGRHSRKFHPDCIRIINPNRKKYSFGIRPDPLPCYTGKARIGHRKASFRRPPSDLNRVATKSPASPCAHQTAPTDIPQEAKDHAHQRLQTHIERRADIDLEQLVVVRSRNGTYSSIRKIHRPAEEKFSRRGQCRRESRTRSAPDQGKHPTLRNGGTAAFSPASSPT